MARKKYRGSSVKRGNFIEMYGVSDLLNQIEKAGGKVDIAVKKCVENSLNQVGLKMQLFMMEHRLTGETYDSYELVPAKIKNNVVSAQVGYELNEGLPAIFLDVGTPSRKPYFFRYYAIENSATQLKEIQRATLEEILKELK